MASPAPTGRAALKVFGIPELAHLICDIIQKRDHANLMQVCRGLFYSILPFVWKEVDRPDMLVSMIPGGGIVSYESEVAIYEVMQLPGSLDLSRFNIYAPHVKRLTLCRMHVDAYDGWDRFLGCTRSVDLLPNLEAIYFPTSHISTYTLNDERIDTTSANWAIAFLSTSLKSLVQAPLDVTHPARIATPLWLDFNSFNSLMTSVAQKCPHLCSLSILPAQVKLKYAASRFNLEPAAQIMFSCDYPDIYSSFLQLGNLTSLLISAAILCPEGLAALSDLPKLASLCVVSHMSDRQTRCDGLQIPDKAFPALKHLELSGLKWKTIFNLCNAKPLIVGLQSVIIIHRHPRSSDAEGAKGFSDILASLAAHSPNITTLSVHGLGVRQLPPEALQPWGQLPLVSLHLGWHIGRTCQFSGLCSILSCLPLLQNLELGMEQIYFNLGQLRTILEHLPRLRHIRIPVKWESVTGLTDADFIPSLSRSNDTLYLKSNFYLPGSQQEKQESVERLARYLFVLRPLAPVVCESYLPYFRYSNIDYTGEEPQNMINAELSRLRVI
ncbi:hypothetical protein RSOL_391880 [Rhizoctonia solani AG-3 Rhs1AP]|uniref:F-box-like domain protein n=2 Tax=Rhizoctonia solani AG-3 TaxID=1086053 RepID=A0A074RL73_9AGAM|nr:hypothetical protein RSOL_391880 [Rhizoctonia solani AG-3 Rhs1AP]KEP47836.1 hypothetical protein V565_142250 [Rhizoctonia solani 123E]